MLKKIMKAALAACLVVGMSTYAMAEVKFSGNVASYFGQYDSGVEDYTAHFLNKNESHINASATAGSITGFIQYEVRDASYTVNAGGADSSGDALTGVEHQAVVRNSKRYAKWSGGAIGVTIGTISGGGCTMSSVPLATSATWFVGHGACPTYFEQDGIDVSLAIPALKGAVEFAIAPKTLGGSTTGQKMGVSLKGSAGPAAFQAHYTSITTDDYSDPDDEAVTDTQMLLGASIPFGKMGVAFDYGSSTPDSKANYTHIGLKFSMKELGPGNFAFVYATEPHDTDGTATYTMSDLDLVYSIPAGKGSSMDFFYLSKTNTPEEGDGWTRTYIGGGFAIGF